MSKSKGEILKQIGGGAVRVITNRQDWETRRIGEGEQAGIAVGQSLVSFLAESYREAIVGSDIWDFLVIEGESKYHVYLDGADIFMLYVPALVL